MSTDKSFYSLSGLLSRRELLAGVAAAGLGGLLPRSDASAAADAPKRAKTLIDFHLHFTPNAPPEALGRGGAPSGRGSGRSLQQVLDMMDEGGVALGLISQGGGVAADNPVVAAKTSRDINEAMAKTIADNPGRFGMFANLPMPHIDVSLREMEYAIDKLKATGVHLLTSYQSTMFLGDPKFDPLFEELNRRKIVVKTHPAGNPCCQGLWTNTGFDSGLVELGTDTMRGIGRMLYSGAAEKFKDVPIIWSHSGGSMVAFAQRFYGAIENNPRLAEAVPQGPEFYLRRFYYDVAQAYHPVTLRALKTLVPMSHIVFGTDYSYRTALQTIEAIEKGGVFNAEEIRGLGYGNGRKLLGLRA